MAMTNSQRRQKISSSLIALSAVSFDRSRIESVAKLTEVIPDEKSRNEVESFILGQKTRYDADIAEMRKQIMYHFAKISESLGVEQFEKLAKVLEQNI